MQANTESTSAKASTDKHQKSMMWLWGQFTKFYGGKAKNNLGVIGGEAYLIWAGTLRSFSFESIKAGLRATVSRKDTWPPELQEFVYLCANNKQKVFHKDFIKKIGSDKSSKEFAASHREKLKELLG